MYDRVDNNIEFTGVIHMRKRPKIYALAINKGGLTKTTTSVNLATAFAELMPDKRILLIDTDGQGNVALTFGIDPDQVPASIFDVFSGEKTIEETAMTIKDNLDIVPANIDLNFLELDYILGRQKVQRPAFLLKDALEKSNLNYDYIFIDTPPGLGLMAANILNLPAKVIVPFEPDTYALKGLIRVIDQMEDIRKTENPKLELAGILFVKVRLRTSLHKELLQQVREYAIPRGYNVFNTIIPDSIKFANAVAYDQRPAILGSEKDTEIVQSYKRLAQEILYLEENQR